MIYDPYGLVEFFFIHRLSFQGQPPQQFQGQPQQFQGQPPPQQFQGQPPQQQGGHGGPPQQHGGHGHAPKQVLHKDMSKEKE